MEGLLDGNRRGDGPGDRRPRLLAISRRHGRMKPRGPRRASGTTTGRGRAVDGSRGEDPPGERRPAPASPAMLPAPAGSLATPRTIPADLRGDGLRVVVLVARWHAEIT